MRIRHEISLAFERANKLMSTNKSQKSSNSAQVRGLGLGSPSLR